VLVHASEGADLLVVGSRGHSDRKATTNLYGTMARTHIIGAKIGAKPLDNCGLPTSTPGRLS
jgi:hypothetical protein